MSYISQLMQRKYREKQVVQKASTREGPRKRVSVNVEPHIVTLTQPSSPAAEEYRILRTTLSRLGAKKPLKTVMITSAGAQEGKTLTSVNLAVAMAQGTGQRILLADCDLRRGRVHELLGVEPDEGLGDVLLNGTDLSAALYDTSVENLTVLPCGRYPANPAELLGSQKMNGLIAQLKLQFSLCIFDTPPALALTDAAVLASQADGVILVVQAGKTTCEAVEEAGRVLTQAHANVLGFILVGVEEPGPGYAYRYHRQASKADGRAS
ncbi:MAG: CpsD/CapB family tyrosine-protein kinase [Candidatus Omnitrophica bacterium]|nr:CpsD/CapB family tyrosine-protein kinase [Candidatus Omnitrophota bacterium]